LIITSAGTRILTDPYDPSRYDGTLTYDVFDEPVDIVTISHDHNDHKAVHLAKGTPIVIRGNGKFCADEVDFLGVETYHDDQHGAKRGKNTVFIITADRLRIAHLGDLGHVLSSDQAAEIGTVDVVLVPVGRYFTIDASQAAQVAQQVGAKIVIPMHYRTAKCTFDIAGVDEFINGKPNVVIEKGSVLDVTAGHLPRVQQIVVLEPSM
jgi:L-ascorbate metabolism protein UlaG (beta-lactamase superfamily)